jgi:hypothetical protein
MTKKTEWEIQQAKIDADRKKAMKSMTEEQIEVIKKTHNALEDVLTNIQDIEDIYLSDIRALNECMWKLKYEFNLGKD